MVETPLERAETARVRRRWINLGEALAVVAVVISGLTFWNSYKERTESREEKQAESQKASVAAVTLVLRARPTKDRDALEISPADPDQTIQSQRIVFATSAGIDPIDTTGEAHIDADWIANAVKGKDRPHDRDLRLPIALTTRFVNTDGVQAEATALYNLGYRIEGKLIGTSVKLTGLSLIGKTTPDAVKKRLDALAK